MRKCIRSMGDDDKYRCKFRESHSTADLQSEPNSRESKIESKIDITLFSRIADFEPSRKQINADEPDGRFSAAIKKKVSTWLAAIIFNAANRSRLDAMVNSLILRVKATKPTTK
jgi:hypothetical protein